MSDITKDSIYLNAAGHGAPDGAVYLRMIDHMELERQMGPEESRLAVVPELQAVRENAARLIGAETGAVAFSSSTSTAFGSVVSPLVFKGKRILVAPHEWGSNVVSLQRLAPVFGGVVERLPDLDLETPDLSAWQAVIDDDVAAIFAPMVTSVAGLRYPVEAIGHLQRPSHALFIVDAAQALGQMPVDVGAIGCDALVATTRKWLRGPKQTALLWTGPNWRRDAGAQPFPAKEGLVYHRETADHSDIEGPARFEQFAIDVSRRLGLGVAIQAALDKTLAAIQSEVLERANHARGRVQGMGLTLIVPNCPQSGAVAFRVLRTAMVKVQQQLQNARITAKWPDTYDEPLANLEESGSAVLRIAPHYYNSVEEIDAVFDAIEAGLT